VTVSKHDRVQPRRFLARFPAVKTTTIIVITLRNSLRLEGTRWSAHLHHAACRIRTFRPADSSLHGRFGPCMDISPHGRFPHRRRFAP